VFTSIKESAFEKGSVLAYPNPVRNVVNLEYQLKDKGSVSLEIRDMSGRIVKTEKLSGASVSKTSAALDISDLSSGMYMLILKSGNSQVGMKLKKIN
jgi:hypothetical protein